MSTGTTIEDRVILLLRDLQGSRSDELGGHGFWERLAGITEITSKRWRKVYAREQRVTSDMIEALAQLFPRYAFWVASGITDATNGHLAPDNALTFPERLYVESVYGDAYWSKCIELQTELFENSGIDWSDEKQRMYAVERTMPLGSWVGSELVGNAYELAKSGKYDDLVQLWRLREDERAKRIELMTRIPRPGEEVRDEVFAQGAKKFHSLGVDPRTKHQDRWDLFYVPKEK